MSLCSEARNKDSHTAETIVSKMQSHITVLNTHFEVKEHLWKEERAESIKRQETSDFHHIQCIGEFGQMSGQLQGIVGVLRQKVLENKTQLQNVESVAMTDDSRANTAQIKFESA